MNNVLNSQHERFIYHYSLLTIHYSLLFYSHSIVNSPRKARIGAGFSVVTSVNTMKNTIINNLFPVTYHPVNNSCCVRLQSPS